MANIKVCDDSALIRLQLKNIFDSHEHEIMEAVDFEGIKRENFSPEHTTYDLDIVFLDLYLEDIHGFKVLDYFNSYYPEIPVVIISVENRKEIIMDALKKGAEDYILKPFDKTFMVSKLDSILNKRNQQDKDKYLKIRENKRDFQNELKIEIKRTTRSEMAFTIMKFTAKKNMTKKQIHHLKEIITNILRDIDRTFILDKNSFVLLLPLTDREGAKQLYLRIESAVGDKYSLDSLMDISVYTFPDEFIDDINYKKRDEYFEMIKDKIGFSL